MCRYLSSLGEPTHQHTTPPLPSPPLPSRTLILCADGPPPPSCCCSRSSGCSSSSNKKPILHVNRKTRCPRACHHWHSRVPVTGPPISAQHTTTCYTEDGCMSTNTANHVTQDMPNAATGTAPVTPGSPLQLAADSIPPHSSPRPINQSINQSHDRVADGPPQDVREVRSKVFAPRGVARCQEEVVPGSGEVRLGGWTPQQQQGNGLEPAPKKRGLEQNASRCRER